MGLKEKSRNQSYFCIIIVLTLFSIILFSTVEAKDNPTVFNVVDFGAVGDGITNDTEAFAKAWSSMCDLDVENSTMIVPQRNTFLLHLITFSGPCKPKNINFEISGSIIAPESYGSWEGMNKKHFILFNDVNRLHISGYGSINGRAKGWWNITCKLNPHFEDCIKLAPAMLSFINCSDLHMSNISLINSPQVHILVYESNDVKLRYLNIKSPQTSPNTDGIHISSSHSVSIQSTNISSGDDCISIGDHTSNIYIKSIHCGPGDGVSIGNLGKKGNEVRVENITVNQIRFKNTSNGARIKTWQAGRGYVRGITFKNLNLINVKNPIIIDQYYCDIRNDCPHTETGVHISDVQYHGIFGTSNSKRAIDLNCSEVVPCTNILLDDIHLTSSSPGKKLTSTCNNAFGHSNGVLQPKSCLLE